ncbi:MAG: hypothetical protein ACLT2F_08650, partial [Butyricicoccus sp.]
NFQSSFILALTFYLQAVYVKYFLITNRNAAERKKIGRSKLSSTSSYGLLQLPLIINIIPYFVGVRQG